MVAKGTSRLSLYDVRSATSPDVVYEVMRVKPNHGARPNYIALGYDIRL